MSPNPNHFNYLTLKANRITTLTEKAEYFDVPSGTVVQIVAVNEIPGYFVVDKRGVLIGGETPDGKYTKFIRHFLGKEVECVIKGYQFLREIDPERINEFMMEHDLDV